MTEKNRQIFFLNGLGGTKEEILPFFQALHLCQVDVEYLSLPGHESEKSVNLITQDEFIHYYRPLIGNTSCILIGYSIGAEIAVFLAQHLPNIEKIILIDGGLVCGEDFGISIEEDIVQTLAVIKENQITSLNAESIASLLRFTDEIHLGIMHANLKIPILIINSSQKEVLAIKQQRLAQLSQPNITHYMIEQSTHQLLTEYPEKVAQEIQHFI